MQLFFYVKKSIFSVSPEGLVSTNLLIEIKPRTTDSAGPPLQDLRKNSHYFIQTQLQMICTSIKNCIIILSYHSESTNVNYSLVTQHNLLWDAIGIVVNSIYHVIIAQEWPHRENLTLPNIKKNILECLVSNHISHCTVVLIKLLNVSNKLNLNRRMTMTSYTLTVKHQLQASLKKYVCRRGGGMYLKREAKRTGKWWVKLICTFTL